MAEYITPADTVTLAPGAAPAINTTANWTEYRNLPVFSIRNGRAEQATSLLIKATIPRSTYWVPIADLATRDAIKAVDGFIRSHLMQIHANTGSEVGDALKRKMAIVLGTIRAVATTFFELTHADLISGEVATPYLAARKGTDGVIYYDLAPGVANHEILSTALVFTLDEQAAISAMVKCGVGVGPMQGYSLIMTGHHYLSDANTQSRKVFDVVERAYWKDNAIGEFFTAHLGEMQDTAWHKSTHPIQMSLKESWAMNPEIPEMLKVSQAGACASRLPASEPSMRAANSYLTCISAVTHLLKSVGVTSNYSKLEEAIAAVECHPIGKPSLVRADLTSVPEHVRDRKTALLHLDEVLKKAGNVAAFCYGFYSVLSDQTQAVATENAGVSLKGSYSLTKLSSQCYPMYLDGQQFYGDYVALRNQQRADGSYRMPNLDVD